MNKVIKNKKKIKMWVKQEKKLLYKTHCNNASSCGVSIVFYDFKTGYAEISPYICGRSNTYWIKKLNIYPVRKIKWIEIKY